MPEGKNSTEIKIKLKMSIKRTIIVAVAIAASVAMVAPTFAGAVTIDELLAQIAQLQAQLLALQQAQSGGSSSIANCTGVTFTRNMTVGATGSDVKCLQTILNQSVTTRLAVTGVGSPGSETSYFGPLTLSAVKVYQAEHGWTPANQVGPLTRAALNASLSGGGTVILPPVNPTGPVSATLSFDNPAAGALIESQAGADLLHINFTGTGTITSVTLQRNGVSDQNTVSSLYLYDGVNRLTDGYSFNVNGTTTINGLDIAVNGSKVISVKTDFSACITAGTCGTIAVSMTGYTANGTASSANVMGNMFGFITGSSATAYMTTNTATSTANVNAGTTQYTMWSDTIQVNTRAVQFKGMSFKMIGSAPTNALANIKLFIDGVDSGTVATIGTIQGSNYAMFNFVTPINLTTGTHTIDVRADIVTGANRTIQLSVQQAADMVLYDAQVGVNFAIQASSGTTFVADSGTTVTILTGSSTVVVDPSFTSLTNITAGSTNAVIGKFLLHGYGEDVKVNTLYVTPVLTSATLATGTCTDATTCTLSNLTLYFNGSQIGSQDSVWTASDGYSTFSLGSQMIIPAGQDSTLEVRADLQTSGGVNYTGGTIAVTLEGASTNNNAQGQSSSEIIDIPGSDVSTTGLTISSASLVVSKNTSYANSTINPNTQGARIGSYTLQNQSSSEATRLTSLNVKMYDSSDDSALSSSTTPTLTNFSALRTSDTTGAGSTPITPTGNDTFSVTDVLQPGASMTIDIYANTASEASSYQLYTTLTVASIGAVSNIADSGTVATGQTITLGSGTVATPTLVTASTTPAQFIAAGGSGAQNASQATFSFISTSAPSTITELKFTVTGSDANPTQAVSQICVGSVCGSPAVVSSTQTVYLTGLSLAVPTGAGLTQNVLVSYSPVGIGGVTSASTAAVTLTYVKYNSGGTTTAITPSVAAPTMTLVGSKPTVVVTNSSVSGLNYGGVENKIGEVTITADAKGGIKLNDLKFTVSASGFTTDPTYTLARIADGNTTVTGTGCGQGVAAASSQTIFCEFGTSGNTFTTTTAYADVEVNTDFDGYLIAAGTSKTLSLFATVSGADTGTATQTISSSLVAAGFNWDDTASAVFAADATTASPSSGTNQTGASIYNFPTNSYSIHD